jgi:pilus assembly protein Flp/PilA
MRRFISRHMGRFWRDESGATALEYGIILALMFLVILSALTAFGGTGSGIFNTAMDKLRTAMGG